MGPGGGGLKVGVVRGELEFIRISVDMVIFIDLFFTLYSGQD